MIRSILRSAVCLTVLALAGGTASAAEDGPSFNCAKAGTAVEKAICDGEGLARMDRDMARLYGQLRKSMPELAKSQRAWLRERNKCGGDFGCLWWQMAERWVALGEHLEKAAGTKPLSGIYDYTAYPKGIEGELILVAEPDGGYGFHINTVTLQRAHICEVNGTGVKRDLFGGLLWHDPGAAENCTLRFTPKGPSEIAIAVANCPKNHYCGHRGAFSGSYSRKP